MLEKYAARKCTEEGRKKKQKVFQILNVTCNASVVVSDCVFVQGDSVIQYLEVSDTAASYITQGNNSILDWIL